MAWRAFWLEDRDCVFANVFLRLRYCEIQYFVDSAEQTHFTRKRKLC